MTVEELQQVPASATGWVSITVNTFFMQCIYRYNFIYNATTTNHDILFPKPYLQAS